MTLSFERYFVDVQMQVIYKPFLSGIILSVNNSITEKILNLIIE